MLYKNLENAIKQCNGEKQSNIFGKIYPFTTENINGYINNFELKNKSLLTVGSSGDQVINAIYNNCKDITLLDINPYVKYYYFLKIASIIALDYNSFFEFLRFTDYPREFKTNLKVFDDSYYKVISKPLKELDLESYLFWDYLFKNFPNTTIRYMMFFQDEEKTNVLKKTNKYLENEIIFNEVKSKIAKTIPKFINKNVFDFESDIKYDNIWLSNIGTYLDYNQIKKMTDNMSKYLNVNGNMLVSYLYKYDLITTYKHNLCKIYNLEHIFELLKDYDLKLIPFDGIRGFRFNYEKKDSILLYKKIK